MSDESVIFVTDGLLSKWGFQDGDLLDDIIYDAGLYDAESTSGYGFDHDVLIAVVERHVAPKVDQRLVLDRMITIHNPIRARTVDGVEVDYYEDNPFSLTPEVVEVPLAEVLAICAELAAAPLPPVEGDAPEGSVQ